MTCSICRNRDYFYTTWKIIELHALVNLRVGSEIKSLHHVSCRQGLEWKVFWILIHLLVPKLRPVQGLCQRCDEATNIPKMHTHLPCGQCIS